MNRVKADADEYADEDEDESTDEDFAPGEEGSDVAEEWVFYNENLRRMAVVLLCCLFYLHVSEGWRSCSGLNGSEDYRW